jgi:hypothetical protein
MNVIQSVAFPCGRTFAEVINDLVHEPVEFIVNAANSGLTHVRPSLFEAVIITSLENRKPLTCRCEQ